MITNPSLLKGGNVDDVSAEVNWMARPHIEVAASLQYERWNFAELNPGPRSNISSSLEIRVWPKLHLQATANTAGSTRVQP
jgi:hypothetical protein